MTDNYEKIDLTRLEKWFMIFIVISTIILMSTSLYLQWTPVGSRLIEGIQGRYFIPLFALLAFVSTKIKIMPKINWSSRYLYLFLISLNSCVLASIFLKFL